MNLPDNAIFQEIRNNFVSILGIFAGIIWLSSKQGYLNLVKKWYVTHTNDEKGILAPSLVTLTAPFIVPITLDIFQSREVGKASSFTQPVITLSIFILGQEVNRRRTEKEREQAKKRDQQERQKVEYLAFRTIINEVSENTRIHSNNLSQIKSTNKETGESQTSMATLMHYQKGCMIKAREEYAEALLENNLFDKVYSLSMQVDKVNQLIDERQNKIESYRREAKTASSNKDSSNSSIHPSESLFRDSLNDLRGKIEAESRLIQWTSIALEMSLEERLSHYPQHRAEPNFIEI